MLTSNQKTGSTPVTESQTKRVLDAIVECNRFINMESKRSNDLRPKEIKDLLIRYKTHKAKLLSMLELG